MTGTASLAAACVLALSIALLCAGRIGTAICVCAIQALLAAATLAAPRWQPAAIALFAFALNGVALPLALQRVCHAAAMPPVIAARNGLTGFWLATLAMLVIVVAAFAQVRPGSPRDALVVGSSVVLLGLLLIARRSHPLAPALGLLSSQNGLLLIASAISDLPLSAHLVIVLPLVPGLILANAWLRQ